MRSDSILSLFTQTSDVLALVSTEPAPGELYSPDVCIFLCPAESFRPGESKENTYGPKFDVYSLGMVILALVLGRSGDQPPGSYDDLKGDAVQQDEGLRDFLHQALER